MSDVFGSANEAGQRYDWAAATWRSDYGILASVASDHLEALQRLASENWKKTAGHSRTRYEHALGCISRLTSFLLQSRRIADHVAVLSKDPLSRTQNIAGAPDRLVQGVSLALQGHDVCTDFESLLFHARAALDRTTRYISEGYKQGCDRFSRLTNVLGSFDDAQSHAARRLLGFAPMAFDALADGDGKKGLRSQVAHRSSLLEGSQNYFTLHCIEDEQLLLFDCESFDRPVLKTAHGLSAEVPFLIQNLLALYLGHEALEMDEFRPTWDNPSVVFTEYVDDSGRGRRFSLFRADPEAIHVVTNPLRPEVLDHAFKP